MGKKLYGIGSVYTYDYKLRNPKTKNVGFGYYDPSKVFFKEDPNGYVMVDGKLVSLTDKPADAPEPVDPYTYEQIGDKTYKTIQVGNTIWMAENLDFKWEGLTIDSTQVCDGSEVAACYIDDDEATWGWNGRKTGLLYSDMARYEILNQIEGWRYPTQDEMDALRELLDGQSYKIVPPNSEVSWGDYTNEFPEANEYLLSMLPVGRYQNDQHTGLGQEAHFVVGDSSWLDNYDVYFPGTSEGGDEGFIDPGWGTWNDGAVEVRLVKDI